MEHLLHEGSVVDRRRQLPQFRPDLLDLPVLGALETAVGDDVAYLLDLARVEPYAVAPALVDDHPRDTAEVLTVHHLAASDAGDVLHGVSGRLAERGASRLFVPVDIVLARKEAEF